MRIISGCIYSFFIDVNLFDNELFAVSYVDARRQVGGVVYLYALQRINSLGLLLGIGVGRALKNYRYFHFIGVFRRHYRAFTRRSGYDVW